jgi:DNA-binding transcriptional ArsR family regulator
MTQATRVDTLLRARFFHGLADLSRLALLEALREGERTAGEAATAARLSPSNASRHLACLRACGLVESRQEWRQVFYRLAHGVEDLLAANDQFIERVADRIAACSRPGQPRAVEEA